MPASKADRAMVRAQATRSVMEKTDRLLGWDGRVKIIAPRDDLGPDAVPAWTDGTTITINGTNAALYKTFHEGFDRSAMLWVSGLNYHELAHCLFTPRLDSELARAVREEGEFLAFNALEDQAAESKFVRLYEPAMHYFTAVITELMAGREDLVGLNYPLIAGRKFLPPDLRQLFRENYQIPEHIPKFEEIIDEYCDCVFPTDQKRMGELISEYHRLIQQLQSETGDTPSLSSHHGDGDGDDDEPDGGLERGSTVSVSKQREATSQPQVGKDLKSDDEEGSGEGSEDDADDGDEEGEGEGEGQTVDLPGGKGAGQSEDISTKWEPEILDDLIEQINEDSEQEMSEELDSRANAIKATENEYRISSDQSPYNERPPGTEHTSSAKGVEQELRRLKQKYKPGWNRRQEIGKVDTNQIANIRRGRQDVFKRFQPGVNNALDFEVVLMLDQSGSMYTYSQPAGSALWVLHKSMKSIGAEITVLGYSDAHECRVLMQRGIETPRHVRDYYMGGATYVMPALEEARRVFRVSRKALKLLVIVTDGVFSDPHEVDRSLRDMTEPVAIVGINEDVKRQWSPDKIPALKVAKTIQHPSDLVPFTRDLVMDLARSKYGAKTR